MGRRSRLGTGGARTIDEAPCHSRRTVHRVFAAVAALVAASAMPASGDAAPAARPPPAPGGTIRGTVRWDGPPPERAVVRRDTDPYCNQGEARSEDIVVTDGKLRDVLVRIKNGSWPRRAAGAPPPPPVVIDQKGCAYTPRVVGLVAGQALRVRNSDGTFHNVRGSIGGSLLWNKPSIAGDPELTLDGSPRAGDVLDIGCDVHPWMRAYAVVQDHTAFAVTGEDGAFALTGVPPGAYTIEAWHPTLGLRTARVKLGGGAKTATVQLSYPRNDPR